MELERGDVQGRDVKILPCPEKMHRFGRNREGKSR